MTRSPIHQTTPAVKRKPTPQPAATANHQTDEIARMLQLQRTIGNQATLRLTNPDTIQLGRKGKRKKNKNASPPPTTTLSQAEIKKRIIAGEKKRAEEKKAQNSWGAWFASWIPGGTYEAPTEDVDEDDEGGSSLKYDDVEMEGEGGGFVGETELGEAPKEEEAESGGMSNPFAIEQIEFDLGTGKMEQKGTRIGDVKGSTKESVTGGGEYKASATGSTEGRYGKAEGEGKLKLSQDNLEGEGKVSMLFGASSEQKSGTLGWGIGGHKLEGSGTMESKVGLTGDLAGKLAYNSKKFAAEGKMGAFLGAISETSVNIKLKSNGKDLGSSMGKLGIAYGAGGELNGTISWEGGKFEFGWHGKLVAGIGFSYGYKLTLNTDAVADTMVGWLPTVKYWLWDAWSLPDDVDIDDILII